MDIRRVALLVDAYDQPGGVCELMEWLAQSPDFELAAVLVVQRQDANHGWGRNGGPVMRALSSIERLALPGRQRALLAGHDLRDAPAPVSLWPSVDVAITLRNLDLDLIIAPDGLPVPREQLRGVARLGVWCMAYYAMASGSGRYAGFWEVLHRADHTAQTLWRLAERAENDEVIERRSFNTENSWLKNQARAFGLGKLMICDALDDLAGAGQARQAEAVPYIDTEPRHGCPTQRDGSIYAARQAWAMAALVMRRIGNRNVRWRIGLLPSARPPARVAQAHMLMPPAGTFFADPFVYVRDQQPYIFFEDYDFRKRKGRIAAATFRDGRFELLGDALDLPYHLSFPCVFEYQGALYMVPESCANRSIELWKCVDFPLKWELDNMLMSNISAVDTLVFQHGEYWWLFTNIDRTESGSYCDELFGFYASSPVSADWIPHAANPIVRNPARARNAGLVVGAAGAVIRCAQHHGFGHYGNGLSLNRIEKLTPLEYRESEGEVHYPQFVFKSHASMHHWHGQDGYAVFDYAFRD